MKKNKTRNIKRRGEKMEKKTNLEINHKDDKLSKKIF
jgi:hypothetical protein